MSAYMVDNTHIDALLTAGMSHRFTRYSALYWYFEDQPYYLTIETAGQVGAMLLAENRRSVDYRYQEEELEEPYQFRRLPGSPDPLIVLRALACYEYQACECDDWEQTAAYRFVDALRRAVISELTIDVDVHEIVDRNVFLQPVKKVA